jgi:hypothetical protein
MESGLEALARGLRGAGGILNSDVQKADMQEEQQNRAVAEQRRNLMAQLAIKGAEAGSIDPDRATQTLRGLGYDVPEGAIGPSPEAVARKQALDNERGFRSEWGQLAPDAPLSQRATLAAKWGKPELSVTLFNQEQARIERQQARQEALEERARQFDLRLQDQKLQTEQRAELSRMADETRRQIALGQQEVAKQGAEFRRAQLEFQTRDKADRELQRRTTQLQGALEKSGLPEVDAVLKNAEQALAKAPNLAEYLTGPKSTIPDWMLPADVKAAKQAFTKLFNVTLKQRSGAAVTNQELDRLKAEFGAGAFKTPEQIQIAINQMRGVVKTHYVSVAAGFGKDALREYNDFVRGYGGSVVLDDEPKSDPLGIL